jgi:hypothetical protein
MFEVLRADCCAPLSFYLRTLSFIQTVVQVQLLAVIKVYIYTGV